MPMELQSVGKVECGSIKLLLLLLSSLVGMMDDDCGLMLFVFRFVGGVFGRCPDL